MNIGPPRWQGFPPFACAFKFRKGETFAVGDLVYHRSGIAQRRKRRGALIGVCIAAPVFRRRGWKRNPGIANGWAVFVAVNGIFYHDGAWIDLSKREGGAPMVIHIDGTSDTYRDDEIFGPWKVAA